MLTPRVLPNPSGSDDTATIQAALNALRPGQWLIGQPGAVYLHSKSLQITVPGSGLAGARLHATNPDDQAILIRAHGVTVQGNDLTAVTDRRRSAPWQARISVWGLDDGSLRVCGSSIVGNTIREDGPAGSATQNGASSGGIFLYNASQFEVRDNIVRRTCSDAIHITAGSCHGIVTGNQSIECGDDGIAVVSYAGPDLIGQPDLVVRARRIASLCSDVLIERNVVRGIYWGRGITTVGGRQVTIRGNHVSRIYGSAGILLAREAARDTWAVTDVRVERNTVEDIQTGATPDFCPTGPGFAERVASMSLPKSGQGGIEVHATSSAEHWAVSPDLLIAGWITISGNKVARAPVSVRIGAHSPAGSMRLVQVNGNTLDRIAVAAGTAYQGSVTHHGNVTHDGSAITSVPNCTYWLRESAYGARVPVPK